MPASCGEKPSGGEGRTPARSDHSVPTRLGEQKSRCAQLQGCLEEGRSPGRVRGGGACGTSRGFLGSDSGKRSPHPRRTAHGQLPHLRSAAQSALGLQGLRLRGGGWQESWGKLPSRGKHPDAPGKVEVSIVALTLPSSPCRWAASGWSPPPPAAQRPGTGTHTKLKRQRETWISRDPRSSVKGVRKFPDTLKAEGCPTPTPGCCRTAVAHDCSSTHTSDASPGPTAVPRGQGAAQGPGPEGQPVGAEIVPEQPSSRH